MPVINTDELKKKLHAERDLYRQKVEEIENKIRYIEELEQMAGVTMAAVAIKASAPKSGEPSLSDAIVGLLEERREWLSTAEIAEELSRRGYEEKSTSGNFKMMVLTAVPKLWKRSNPKIDRIDGPNGIKYGMLGLKKPDEQKEDSLLANRN
ncbi:MAG: hypothetical protein M0Z48_05945 [Nitrospiraceae bacterium]|nr:hypothetical protein [Nitrospiraceae bacterium]